jgi:hypothetical protein
MAQGSSGRLDNREEEEEGYEQLWQLGTNCNGELQGGACLLGKESKVRIKTK